MRCEGVFTVVPTAFHDDGSLDLDGTANVVAACGDAGVAGVLTLGVMGEVGDLDLDEQRRVITTVQRAAGGLPVVVGLGDPGPEQLAAARRATDLGADALLMGLADGDADRRAGLLDSAASIGPPVILQHHPAATGVHVPIEEVVSLASNGTAIGVKAEAPPTPDLIAALVAANAPPALGGLSALYLLEELEVGAAGCMTGLAIPELLVEVVGAWLGGNPTAAQDAYLRLVPYLRLEAMPGRLGLVARKEAWRQRGLLLSSRVRRGVPLGTPTKAAITRRLRDVGVDLVAPWPDA